MPTAFEIPTSPQAQRMTVMLGATLYQLSLNWNAAASCWVMDIADQNGVGLAQGVPLVTGGNLLEQVGYLLIGGAGAAVLVQSDNNPDLVPAYDTLGLTGRLYFIQP
ncbi:phage baseplate plug family protein [Azospirillum argentinense]